MAKKKKKVLKKPVKNKPKKKAVTKRSPKTFRRGKKKKIQDEPLSVDEAFEKENFEEHELSSSTEDFEDGQLDLF